MLAAELSALLRRDLTRLRQEITAFPSDELLWQTVPGVTNSAGNLCLHLEGNLREFIGRQLGDVAYQRVRPAEFGTTGLTRADLDTRIAAAIELIPSVVAQLSPQALAAIYPEDVLGQPLTTSQFVIHLIGHFNYHLGQIDYLRRILTASGSIPLAGL